MKKKAIYGWKKVKNTSGADVLIKLRILGEIVKPTGRVNIDYTPDDAQGTYRRVNKFRSSRVRVIAAFNINSGTKLITNNELHSKHDPSFMYHVGFVARPKGRFNRRTSDSCGSGIHFFKSRKAAELYQFT